MAMNLEWIKDWRKNRTIGLVNHMKQELLEQPELIDALVANARSDPRVVELLKKKGITIT